MVKKNQNWSTEDILQVAKYQSNLIMVILVNIIAGAFMVSSISSNEAVPAISHMFIGVFRIAVLVVSIYFVYCLAKAARSPAILYVILVFIPLLGLIALLHLSGIATKILRDNGIKVGLMGANKSDLESLKNNSMNL